MTDPAAARREAEDARKQVKAWAWEWASAVVGCGHPAPTVEAQVDGFLDAYGAAREALGRAIGAEEEREACAVDCQRVAAAIGEDVWTDGAASVARLCARTIRQRASAPPEAK